MLWSWFCLPIYFLMEPSEAVDWFGRNLDLSSLKHFRLWVLVYVGSSGTCKWAICWLILKEEKLYWSSRWADIVIVVVFNLFLKCLFNCNKGPENRNYYSLMTLTYTGLLLECFIQICLYWSYLGDRWWVIHLWVGKLLEAIYLPLLLDLGID